MKKLNKLQINSEKLMKDEELITLKGGYGTCYGCYGGTGTLLGSFYGCGFTGDEALYICRTMWANTEYALEGVCN